MAESKVANTKDARIIYDTDSALDIIRKVAECDCVIDMRSSPFPTLEDIVGLSSEERITVVNKIKYI